MKIAIIGLGQRGQGYATCARQLGATISHVVDIDPDRLELAKKAYGVPAENCFLQADNFFALGKVADALVIATQDQLHYRMAMHALLLRYPLLLEKPISNDIQECIAIRNEAEKQGVPVTVCHVLRYAPFFLKIKEILDSGELGKIITIQHNENIGNFHIAHSYVRGNWRKEAESSPILLAKSCHDLDILIWLTGSQPESVASFGDLSFFKKENAPVGSANRCLDCPVSENCRFDVRKCYLPIAGQWPATVLTDDQSVEGLMKAFREGPYGRCVYRCDNDVCDHQVVIIRFKNSVTATFNMSGFTDRGGRTLKIMCEHGEIRGSMDENAIEIRRFSSNDICERKREVYHPLVPTSGHAGGDMGVVRSFLSSLENKTDSATTIQVSTASHVLAFAAEESRKKNTVVNIEAYEKKICGFEH